MKKKICTVAALLLLLWGEVFAESKSKSNIVIITVDDMGYFAPSCYHRGLASYKSLILIAWPKTG